MAIPTEPVTDALYQALSSPEPDPKVVHAAIEEVRQIASQNVIAVLGAKIDAQGARIDIRFSQIEAQITEVKAEMDTRLTHIEAEMDTRLTHIEAEMDTRLTHIEAEIKTQGARIDDLRQVVWRVIWPLIVLLAVPVFGLLYSVVTAAPG